MKVNKKLVKGYEDNYYLDPDTMQVINKKTGRPLKVQYNKDGYPEVQLWKNNKRKHKSMHRLFAEAYIPNPDSLPMINHKDEGTIDYSLDNLEWCTHSENTIHAYQTGLEQKYCGENHHSHKLTKEDVEYIKQKYIKRDSEFGAVALANKFGVDRTTIHDIIRGKTWREVV